MSSRFKENYRTDWLVDLNQMLVFQLLDELFFPELEESDDSGSGDTADEVAVDEMQPNRIPDIGFQTAASDLGLYSNDEISRSLFFREYCRCSNCLLDVAAVALNSLKPLYRIDPAYSPFSTLQKGYRQKVRAAILEAMKIVMLHPHH